MDWEIQQDKEVGDALYTYSIFLWSTEEEDRD